MECTWTFNDGSVCGRPADCFRAKFIEPQERYALCPMHRAVTPDDDARSFWGVETYELRDRAATRVAIIEDQDGPVLWFGDAA